MGRIALHNHPLKYDGFTVVEMLVTTVVVSLFLIMFYQSFMALESQRIFLARNTAADQLAYTNLHKVTSRSTIVANNISCVSTVNGADLFASNSGYTAEPQSSSTDTVVKDLGSGTIQKLQAYPSSGSCTGSTFGTGPIRIVSRVIYSFGGVSKEVDHAGYVY